MPLAHIAECTAYVAEFDRPHLGARQKDFPWYPARLVVQSGRERTLPRTRCEASGISRPSCNTSMSRRMHGITSSQPSVDGRCKGAVMATLGGQLRQRHRATCRRELRLAFPCIEWRTGSYYLRSSRGTLGQIYSLCIRVVPRLHCLLYLVLS